MKRLPTLLCALVLVVAAAAFFTACDDTTETEKEPPAPQLQQFTGVTFADSTVTYDGNKHIITVTGAPEGTQIAYENNEGTNAGVYNATATLTKENYQTATLTAKLTIDKATFTGVTFADSTVTYDGNKHIITVTGAPEGTQIAYENNEGTHAGVYNATATLTKENYQTATLNAKLTIDKATFTGITLSDRSFVATGTPHSLEIDGDLPDGAQVTYKNNAQKDAGTYTVTAEITHPNYKTLTLTATMEITKIGTVAKDVIDALCARPDPWEFMPEGLRPQNMAYKVMPVNDFTNFVNVSQIGKRAIGKQLNVLYDGVTDTATLLGYVDTVFAAGSAIAGVYQTFINRNPDNHASFTGEAAGFKVHILLDGADSTLLAGNSVVSAQLHINTQTGVRTGRVQLTDGMALKYEYTQDALKFAVKTTIAGVGNVKQIEFTREDGVVAGLLYEYTGTETKNLKTTAQILFNDTVAIIVSDKRETEDLLINGYEEVYNAKTGEYLGGEVAETVKAADYDTLWFMLADVSGFTSVKAIHETNGTNSDTIYLNNAAAPMHTKLVGEIGLKMGSRRFDVEMKDVWYITAEQGDNGKVTYTRTKTQIPMVFVQNEHADTFGKDVQDSNKNEFAAPPQLPLNIFSALTGSFPTLKEAFTQAKALGSYAAVTAYIGSKDAFFDSQE